MHLLPTELLSETDAWIDFAFNATIGVAAVWLTLLILVHWRRQATNLTPVTAPGVKRRAQPDFLSVDHAARQSAFGRADAFEKRLSSRELEQARAAKAASAPAARRGPRAVSLVSLFMSIFSLTTMMAGAIWQVSWIGTVMGNYSTLERIVSVFKAHPCAFTVSILVISYHVVQFFVARKWRQAD